MQFYLQGSGGAKIQCVRQHSVKIFISLSNVNNKHCPVCQTQKRKNAITLMFALEREFCVRLFERC